MQVPNSTYDIEPIADAMPPTDHSIRDSPMLPELRKTPTGDTNIPLPTTKPTTIATALNSPKFFLRPTDPFAESTDSDDICVGVGENC